MYLSLKEREEILWKTNHLCELHFKESAFRKGLKRKLLVVDAVPEIAHFNCLHTTSIELDHSYAALASSSTHSYAGLPATSLEQSTVPPSSSVLPAVDRGLSINVLI